MKQIIIMLTVVAVLAGFILALSDQQFKGRIAENAKKALNDSLLIVLPGMTKTIKLQSDMEIYKGINDANETVGYAFIVSGGGYQGVIKMIVSVSPDLSTILYMNVLEQTETPGLGAKITEENFRKQVEGLSAITPIVLIKNVVPTKEKNEIQAISGATISSRAVANSMNKDIARAITIIKASPEFSQ